MKTSTTLILLGAAGVAGFLIWRHFANSSSEPVARPRVTPVTVGSVIDLRSDALSYSGARVMAGSTAA